MLRFLRFGLVAIVFTTVLTACAPPTVDEDAARHWLDELQAAEASAGPLAGVSGSTSDPADTEDMFTITFDEPFPAAAELRAGCFGAPGETATASWTVRAGSAWTGGGGGEIDCDGSMVTLPSMPGLPADVDEVRIAVTRDGEPRLFYAALDAAS